MAEVGGDVASCREHLSCPLCLDIFTEPRVLPCQHTFCLACLHGLLATAPSDRRFRCPSCRARTRVPHGGAADFPNNIWIRKEDLERLKNQTFCQEHPRQDAELFCFECQAQICMLCKVGRFAFTYSQRKKEMWLGSPSKKKKATRVSRSGLHFFLSFFSIFCVCLQMAVIYICFYSVPPQRQFSQCSRLYDSTGDSVEKPLAEGTQLFRSGDSNHNCF